MNAAGRKRLIVIGGVILAVALATEVLLRLVFGLGSPPLYVASDRYEYIQAPNQHVMRFGNRIVTNEYSMRSDPVRERACPTIVFIGDSVLNGGAPTDQDSLATVILERQLADSGYADVQVLNVSAGSWGPDNAMAYLDEQAWLTPDLLVAIFSSHDARDEMDFKPVVGEDISFPDRPPVSAIVEAWSRYAKPRLPQLPRVFGRGAGSGEPQRNEKLGQADPPKVLNPGWEQLAQYAERLGIPTLVWLHPELGELEAGHYLPGGEAIITYLESHGVPVAKGIDAGYEARHYRDNIHLNESGQRVMAEGLLPLIERRMGGVASRCPSSAN